LRKEREIIQQEIAKEKEKLVEVEQRRNDEDLNGQEDVGERKKDRTGKLETGHVLFQLVGGHFNVVGIVISVIIRSLSHSRRPAGNRGIPPFLRSSVALSLGA
jgi:hypothetical protein